jgi:hypothetical protein
VPGCSELFPVRKDRDIEKLRKMEQEEGIVKRSGVEYQGIL